MLALRNASVVTEDCIKRYGGSTAPSKPWPEVGKAGRFFAFERHMGIDLAYLLHLAPM